MISLTDNKIGPEGAKVIGEALKANTSLVYVDLKLTLKIYNNLLEINCLDQ